MILLVLGIAITIIVPYRQVIGQADSLGIYLPYEDSTFGYSIEYPFGWRISHIESEPSTTFISNPDRNEFVFISVNSSIDQNMTTEELGNKIVEVNSHSPYSKDFSLVDRNANDYYLAGHPAVRIEFTTKQFNPITGETQQRLVALGSIIDGKIYLIVISSPDTKFSDYTAQFGHMLYSFKVNEPVGSSTANQIKVSNKPIVTNQTIILKQGLNATLRGIDPNNKSLNFSIYTEPAKGTITFTIINSTSVNATYFPLEDGILTDSFSYKASNGVSDSNIGKVILTFFPPQTSDNGNTSSNIQSQPPMNQSLHEQQQPGNTKPNQTNSFKEPSAVYYEGLDWWGICNNSLVHSYISQPCETLVTPDHRALTLQGKTVLEKILCQKGPSVLSTIELFYGSIPDKAKNEISIACGWQ